MFTEFFIFGLTSLGFLAITLWYVDRREKTSNVERNLFINALKAKTAQELSELKMADNTQVEATNNPLTGLPDLIPESDISFSQWRNAIDKIGLEDEDKEEEQSTDILN